MLLKRNLLESVTVISCGGSLICILLNFLVNISPLNGVWFLVYILLLFFASITFSFKFIQWLLHLNKPIKYDLDILVKRYPFLNSLSSVIPKPPDKLVDLPDKLVEECAEYDTNQLSVISSVLERKLVSSWYVPYISQEIGFPFACKQMLDQMISRNFQICNKIETKDVYISMCAILTTHLKEYKKSIKRHEKAPTTALESHYKKSHHMYSTTNKRLEPADHCTNVLRIILKELVPWELWDIPHSELLIRILSKKLDNFIDNMLSDPVWLNNQLLTILKGNDVGCKVKPETKVEEKSDKVEISSNGIKIEPVNENITKEELNTDMETKSANTVESALSELISKSTAPILQRAIQEDLPTPKCDWEDGMEVEETVSTASEPVDIFCSPVLRQRRGRQGRNEVKIYDRVIEGSVKTWETDVDLQCISLGQDLLASLNGEITLSRLWGQDTDGEPKTDQLWFGEEDTLDMDDTSPKNRSPVKKEHSPKPAEILKDLQTTVHQAKTKIGDLQVLPEVVNNDEAAGMMEGLLDFGIAGLKKGLRFTGLSDESQEKSPSHREKDEKSPPFESKFVPQTSEPKDIGISSVIQKEDYDTNNVPHLVKQQRVASQDSVLILRPIVKGDMPIPERDSPEPEYEEAADLSTSIAKLRSLLNQRALHERGDDIWWEGAEETRGRIQQHHSSKPVDTATLADEYDMNADRNNTSPGQSSKNMQRLFQRTVTGVFNSIKTAVGVEGVSEENAEDLALYTATDWTYVCTSVESSVGCAVARLVGSRRAYNHVDAALDSLDHLAPAAKKNDLIPEDFEEWCASTGAGWSAIAELLSTLGLANTHVTYRIATTIFADLVESLINAWLDELATYLRKQVFVYFEELSNEAPPPGDVKRNLRDFDLDETHGVIMSSIPVSTLYVFGEDTVSNAVKLSLSSFSHKEINKDVIFRVLDLLALHFKKSAGIKHSSFDSN